MDINKDSYTDEKGHKMIAIDHVFQWGKVPTAHSPRPQINQSPD